MPLTINLDPGVAQPALTQQNVNTVLAITTSNDTISFIVNKNFPRVVVFKPTTDASLTAGNATDPKFPVSSGAALHLEISSSQTFQVSADSSPGNLHIIVVR